MAYKKSNVQSDNSVYKYRGYGKIDPSTVQLHRDRMMIPRKIEKKEHDLLDEIFAPDPVSGNPSSDLHVRATADSEIRDFIDRNINAYRIEMEKTSDVDLALASAKSKYESRLEYANRLRDYVNKTKNVK